MAILPSADGAVTGPFRPQRPGHTVQIPRHDHAGPRHCHPNASDTLSSRRSSAGPPDRSWTRSVSPHSRRPPGRHRASLFRTDSTWLLAAAPTSVYATSTRSADITHIRSVFSYRCVLSHPPSRRTEVTHQGARSRPLRNGLLDRARLKVMVDCRKRRSGSSRLLAPKMRRRTLSAPEPCAAYRLRRGCPGGGCRKRGAMPRSTHARGVARLKSPPSGRGSSSRRAFSRFAPRT